MIADGTLVGGQQLRQDELATRLGMSRTPVREAISRLQAEGLAVVERNRGATVFNPTPEELTEIYDIRILLEPRAAQLAVKRANARVLAQLRELYTKMAEQPAWEFSRLNREFHMTLYRSCEHHELYEHIKSLRYRSDPYVRILVGGGGGEQAQRGHMALIEAVADRDELGAASITEDHLNATLETVRAILSSRRAPAAASR